MRTVVGLIVVIASVGCGGGGGGGGGRDRVVPDADPSFGDGGLTTVNFGGGLSGMMAVARQDDGKIVGLGGSRESIALLRVNPDGAFDSSFGVDGVVQLPWGVPTNGVDKSHGIAIQPDGKIVITTRILGVYGSLLPKPVVARFESDGDFDPTFASTGYVVGDDATDLRTIAVQPDGKIVAGGSGRLERFLPDGTRDLTFDTDGIATPGFLVQDLALQSDGKIVTVGGRDLARFTADGVLDTAFAGTSGRITLSESDDLLYSVAIASDGKILAGGTRIVNGSPDPRFAITRFDTTGAVDTGFGTNGIAHDNNTASGGSQAFGIGIAPDGKIVGTGFANVDGVNAGRSARFDENGALDTSFGTGGAGALLELVAFAEPVFEPDGAFTTAGAWLGTGSFAPVFGRTEASGAAGWTVGREIGGSFDRANHVAIAPGGSLVVSGWSADSGGVGVLRLDPDGDHDTTFGTEGFVTYIPGSDMAYAGGSIVQADGGIVLTGPTYQGGFSLVRLDEAGQIDTAFGAEGVVRVEPIAGQRAVSRVIAQGPDGSIFVVGDTATGASFVSEFAVVKLSGSGVRDGSYAGLTTFGAGVNIPTHLVVEPDGAVVTLGLSTAITLVRFDAAGAVDASFGTAGRATVPFSADVRDPFNLLRQPDGKLVAVLGNFQTGSVVLARFGADGVLDSAFGSGGLATFHLAGGTDYYFLQSPMGAAILDDGRIVVGVAESTGDGLTETAVLVRVLPDGSPDEALGPGGIQALELGRASSALHAITLQPDGKLLLAGRVWTDEGGSDFAVLRLLPPD